MGAAFKESFHPFTKLQKIYLITYFKWYLANMVGFIWEGFDETHCQVFVLFLNKNVFLNVFLFFNALSINKDLCIRDEAEN